MKIEVKRYSVNHESTLSLIYVDGVFFCYGLEDEHRTKKVWGETRIPAGTYKLGLRTEGGHHSRYQDKFKFHQGMIQILDVPGFEWILIHIGNDDDDTAGCLLVGDTANNNQVNDGFIGSSTQAYSRLYRHIIENVKNQSAIIHIIDEWES